MPETYKQIRLKIHTQGPTPNKHTKEQAKRKGNQPNKQTRPHYKTHLPTLTTYTKSGSKVKVTTLKVTKKPKLAKERTPKSMQEKRIYQHQIFFFESINNAKARGGEKSLFLGKEAEAASFAMRSATPFPFLLIHVNPTHTVRAISFLTKFFLLTSTRSMQSDSKTMF